MTIFQLERRLAEALVAHARDDAPNECCGIITGKNGVAMKLHRTTNIDHSPVHYTIDPKEMYQIYKEADAQGWELVAFYHSHTHSPAYPSMTDVRLASWPDSIYLLVSLADWEKPILRAYRIVDSKVTEEELKLV